MQRRLTYRGPMFYVYRLIDPRDGKTFYIGKGKAKRLEAHEREARKGVLSKKCNKIRSITDAGLTVQKEIVREFKREDAAYRFEKKLIAESGLENLTNIEPGGRGEARGARLRNDAIRIDRMLGEVLARILKFTAAGQRWMVLGIDTTDDLHRFADAMFAKHGPERVAEMVRPHGVNLVISSG
jgi:hypothetical protein